MEMDSGIYRITNTHNDKCYIGSSKNIKFRMYDQHRRELRKNAHKNGHLQGAWNKYGESLFKFEVLEYCEVDSLIKREQYWIDQYSKEELYNSSLTAGRTTCRTGISPPNKGIRVNNKACPICGELVIPRKSKDGYAKTCGKSSCIGALRNSNRVISEMTRLKKSNALKGKSWSTIRRNAYERSRNHS